MENGCVVKIDHVALYAKDLESARRFFEEMLGGKSNGGYHNPRTGFRSYFISFGDGSRLELMTKPGMVDAPKDTARTGYAHLSFAVGSRDRVDDLTASLRAAGYDVIDGPRMTGDGFYESCVVAIEGNLIELTA